MKLVAALLSMGMLLGACGPTPNEAAEGGVTAPAAEPMPSTATVDWPGYYTGAFPMAGGKHIQVDLWLRSDSSYIVQQLREGDTLREGWVGQWHVVRVVGGPAGGLLTIGYAGDKPDFYQRTEKGLLMVDEMGAAPEQPADWSLEKLADELGDAIPRMRLMGTFTYLADAQSFKPCGATYAWPCVGGMDMGEEEGEPLVPFTNVDLQNAYRQAAEPGAPWVVEAICTMGMGPAMEGDGADEYIFIERAPRTVAGCP